VRPVDLIFVHLVESGTVAMAAIVKPAEELITENAAFIADALKDANIPALMMALIHLTGDTGLLDGEIRPRDNHS
jgi:hypothetical protein